MLFNPSLMLFFISIMISIMFTISSPTFFLVWVALEINTMTFIPFILNSWTASSGEAALKYFLSQTLGSIFLLLSILGSTIMFSNILSEILFLSSLMVKLGAAPFHAWMPSMINFLSWEVFYLLLTIQKLNPLVVLSYYFYESYLLVLVSSVSLLIGSLMGLFQTQIRKILTFSSINQVGWLLIALWLNNWLTFLFFLFYMVVILPVVGLSMTFNLNSLKQLVSKKINSSSQLIFYLNLLSLGGLPPFLGFLPKWLVLFFFAGGQNYFMIFLLIMTSLLTLYYYLRLTFNSFLMNTNQWNYLILKIPPFLILSTQMNILGLPMSFLI